MNTFEARIAAMERTMRRWKIVAGAAICVLSAVLLMGAGTRGKILEADTLLINDETGATRAMLAYEKLTDSTQLTFFNAEQKTLSTFWAQGNGRTGITFYHADGQTRLRVGSLDKDTLALQIQDKDGRQTSLQIPEKN